MANYKIQELLKSGFDFNLIFIEKQDELKKHSGFNFGLQDIALLLAKQTDDFTKDIPVAHDIDDALNGVYLKWKKTQQPEEPKEEPKEQKSKTEQQIEVLEKKIKSANLALKVSKKAEDRKLASDRLASYEKFLKKLQSKKEQGGEMIIETQHSFGDPKENTDPKIDLSFSAQDPKKEHGGGLDAVIKVRNLQNGKISNWALSELIDRINEDNATDENNYDVSDWQDGFRETLTEFYSLEDKNGKPLNDFRNYSKGGALSSDDKKNISEFIKTIENEVQSKSQIKKPRELFFGESGVSYKLEWKQDEQDGDMYSLRLLRFNDELKKYVEEDSMRDSMFIIYAKLEDYRDNFNKYAKGGVLYASDKEKLRAKKHEEAVEAGKKVAAKVYR